MATKLTNQATDQPAEQAADATAPVPTRIEPVLGADGNPVELNPPAGGRWARDADGGLTRVD